jgi:SAM-dependent methyltransferase
VVPSAERQRGRLTFDEIAELYDRARPGYPAALFDDLVALAHLRPGDRVLEIGCGTGQATRPLAERGLDVVCVELGARLAEVARRKLGRFPNVTVINADFETWEPTHADFAAVVAFTAFHWIDPDLRYEKAGRLLRDGGFLALAEAHHVLPAGGDSFWTEVQADYDAVVSSDDNRPAPPPDEIADLKTEIEAGGRFGDVVVRRHLFDVTYTADTYIAVLDTYSGNRVLEPETKRRLFERIRRRIEARPDPHVTKTHLAVLTVARKL